MSNSQSAHAQILSDADDEEVRKLKAKFDQIVSIFAKDLLPPEQEEFRELISKHEAILRTLTVSAYYLGYYAQKMNLD